MTSDRIDTDLYRASWIDRNGVETACPGDWNCRIEALINARDFAIASGQYGYHDQVECRLYRLSNGEWIRVEGSGDE